ncbi:MAG: HipA domain-containing protein [Demequinaceae bacterium]|nr:HipA domain-containing protein [Demequinaceae bacterium]
MADLVVELYGVTVGHLVGTDWRSFDFVAASEAIEAFGLGSTIVSESIPLEARPTPRNAGRRRNFFSELLPEGRLLTRLASQAGLEPNDIVGMLRRYGRDLAGALQIYDPEAPGEPRTPRTEPLSEAAVGAMLRDASLAPLGNDRLTGRTSLGGVQDKIVLARVGDIWHQVHDGAPSTHIVKVSPEERPGLILDEEYGARAARALGLSAFETRIESFDGVRALVLERYDRDPAIPGGRLHQEDMNQALGAYGAMKYEGQGSPVSLLRVADVFRAYGDNESRRRLLTQVTLAVAVGNLDMHAKNLSVLHAPPASGRLPSPTLAPAYDMVPLRHHVAHRGLAMSIEGESDHSRITAEAIAAEGESWGVKGADGVVADALARIAAFVGIETPAPGAHPGLRDDVARFTARLLAGDPVGE